MNDHSVHPTAVMEAILRDVEVDDVRLHPFSASLQRPLRTSRGVIERRDVILVEVHALVGGLDVQGWGEAAPLPGWGTDRLSEVRFDLGRMRDAAYAGGVRSPHTLAAMLRPATARFALSSALLDAVAHARRKPLRLLVNPDAPHAVAVNATIGIDTLARTAELAAAAVQAGFGAIKLKVGSADDVARVAAVRSAAPEAALRLDANGAWSVPEALARLNELAAFDIEYVEQPVAPEEIDGLRQLRDRSDVPIAADESCIPLRRALELVERASVDVMVIKPALVGAWDEIFDLVERAQESGIRVVFTSSIDTVVGRTATAQMAAALLGSQVACGFATGWFEQDVLGREDLIHDGMLNLGSGNGIGFVPRLPGEEMSR